ncbi:phage terminase small subunit [Altericroceibacterium endophyticum]|uniref:Terminase n=1 Tax=Altericroceibacterium endophyticum TaxID=1808508 RepID=A0A6I4T6Y2_9SPHN|nr:phage terminase small subunit [Altericroceibacterium endophyticum]MXO66239.1 terminase [Altericroceibacterium endophyticum]
MSLARKSKLAKLQQREQPQPIGEVGNPQYRTAPPAPSFAGADPLARSADSPARRHKQAKLADMAVRSAAAAHVAPERQTEGSAHSEYELLMAALGEDLRRLKDIQSTEGKIAAKREMIDRYDAHVDATLSAAMESGRAVQDELLTHMMIWRFDIDDFDRGLDIAEHVLRFGLRLPERFRRTAGVVITEEVAEKAIAALRLNRDFPLEVLQRTMQLTADEDMPDEVRAKLEKATGQQLQRIAVASESDPESSPAGAAHAARRSALSHLQRALELDDKCGVKKDIERLYARLRKDDAADAKTAETQD